MSDNQRGAKATPARGNPMNNAVIADEPAAAILTFRKASSSSSTIGARSVAPNNSFKPKPRGVADFYSFSDQETTTTENTIGSAK